MLTKLVKSVSSRALLISSWLLVVGFLFLYSFTQVDLGLTLSEASLVQYFQKSFQYIGYFNRPISTVLFLSIVILLTSLYLWTLWLIKNKKIQARTIWKITFFTSLILLFSYSAFSYDIFNYIFDARIVTTYGQNPYEHKALDYPGDPMLGFMHWTHRTYPYGPIWLGMTIPLSFIGGSFFLFTFYLFKALAVASYLISCYLIEKISKKSKLIDSGFALAFFALNPLVIIESLVSAHIDIVMIALILAGIYFLLEHKNHSASPRNLPFFASSKSKKYSAWFFLLLSASVKFATGILAPLFIWFMYSNNKQSFSSNKNKKFILFFSSILFMIIAVVFASYRTTFQPWYLLLIIPFCSFLSNRYYILIPSVLVSILALMQYMPYLFLGNYDPPVPSIMNQMLWGSICVSSILTLGYVVLKKLKML